MTANRTNDAVLKIAHEAGLLVAHNSEQPGVPLAKLVAFYGLALSAQPSPDAAQMPAPESAQIMNWRADNPDEIRARARAQSPAKDEAGEVPRSIINEWWKQAQDLDHITNIEFMQHVAQRAISWDRQHRAQQTGAAGVMPGKTGAAAADARSTEAAATTGQQGVYSVSVHAGDTGDSEPQQAQGEQFDPQAWIDQHRLPTPHNNGKPCYRFYSHDIHELFERLRPADQRGSATPVADIATTGPAVATEKDQAQSTQAMQEEK